MTTRFADTAELETQPNGHGMILIDAADYWRKAGESDRAIDLLTEAITTGDEDGCSARVALADLFFELDRVDDARAQLDALRQDRPTAPVPYHLAAELLESRDEHQEALTWFNMAVSRLTDEELADRHGEFGFFSYANLVLAGRQRVRRALGLPADDLDESVSEPDPELLARALAHRAPTPPEVQVLYWPRHEVPSAHERWPQLVEHCDVEAILRDREMANRELSEAGHAKITMVPLTVAKLTEFAARTGGDPTDGATRRACLNEIVKDGGTIAWPPARNTPCWCGSGAKYKKCCGRP